MDLKKFIKAKDKRRSMQLPLYIDNILKYQEITIESPETGFALCGTKAPRPHFVQTEFAEAFERMSKEEKVQFYLSDIRSIQQIQSGKASPQVVEVCSSSFLTPSSFLKQWTQRLTIKLDQANSYIAVQNEQGCKCYILSHILVRNSQTQKKMPCFVIQYFGSVPNRMRLGHLNEPQIRRWKLMIQNAVIRQRYLFFQQRISSKKIPKQITQPIQTQCKQDSRDRQNQLIRIPTFKANRSREDLALRLLDGLPLHEVLSTEDLVQVFIKNKVKIFKSRKNQIQYRLSTTCKNKTLIEMAQIISNPIMNEKTQPCLLSSAVQKRIPQENSIILKNNYSFKQLQLKPRELTIRRHVAKIGKQFYVIDTRHSSSTSRASPNLIQVQHFQQVVKLQQEEDGIRVQLDLNAHWGGYITQAENSQMTSLLLEKLEFTTKQPDIKNNLFDFSWAYQQSKEASRKTVKRSSQKYFSYEENPYCFSESTPDGFFSVLEEFSLSKDDEAVVYRKNSTKFIVQQPDQIEHVLHKPNIFFVPCKLDSKGMSIVSYEHLKVKHITNNIKKHAKQSQLSLYAFLTKEWVVDPNGGLIYTDQQKMSAQRGVLKAVVNKIGKNLLEGKPITQISLPVQIFNTMSNLQMKAITLGAAPLFLDRAGLQTDPVAQMELVFQFYIAFQSLYIAVEKPFNPILGQTFQGYIKGCPLYLEQISHHPPILAIYMVSQNYIVCGSLQNKISMKLNSAQGCDFGELVIKFPKIGNQFRIRGNGGQLGGIVFGSRKLNFVGEIRIVSYEQSLVLISKNNPDEKGFFSFTAAKTPCDYFKGSIFKTTTDYLQNYRKTYKCPPPNQFQIIEKFAQVSGVWHSHVQVDKKVVMRLQDLKYFELDYEKYPLPSDSNYREDVIYRRLKDLERSQSQKQRLQNIQRADRKFREQYGPAKNH